MSDLQTTIDTHLAAYGEPDASRRAELVSAVWSGDGTLVDPPIDARGHAGIVEMAGAVQSQFPGHTFRRTSEIDAHHDLARYTWEMVGPDGMPALAGTDVALVGADGRLAHVAGFFGDPAPLAG